MKKYVLTMGGEEQGFSRHNDEGVFRDYQKEAERLAESAKPFGFEPIIYNNDFIKNLPYYELHRDILDKVSFGFAYKAICLYETMKIIEDGDVILWADSNHVFAKDPSVFVDIAIQYGMFCRNHIWVYYPQKEWCRRDTFVNMGCDSQEYWDSFQHQDNIFAICKNEITMNFAKEWFDYCLDYKTMFGENKHENFPGFKHHRHNQAIFSILCHKYKFPYFDRTNNVWGEFVIPEIDGITPEVPVDNSYRAEADRKDNK